MDEKNIPSPELPPEIWGMIFQFLPLQYRKSSFICPLAKCFRQYWWTTRNKIVFKSSISGTESPLIAKLLHDFHFTSVDFSNLVDWTTSQLFTIATANPNIISIKFPEKDLGKREIKPILWKFSQDDFQISSLDTTSYGQLYDDDLQMITRFKNLRELNLWELQDTTLFKLSDRPSLLPQTLRRLSVTFCWLTPTGYEKLKMFTNLEELTLKTLKYRPLQVKNFAWLEPLKKLRTLCLDFHTITPKKLQRIVRVPTLTTLDLSQNTLSESVTSLQPLSRLRNLTVLKLSRVVGVERCFASEQDIPSVFGHLEELDLSWCFEISEVHIKNIGEQIRNEIQKTEQKNEKSHTVPLKRLNLTGCFRLNDPVVGYIINYFGFLESLSLSDCNRLTDAGFNILDDASFQQLKYLDLSFCEKLTEATASKLGKLPKFEHLKGKGVSKKFQQALEQWPEHITSETS